MTNLANHPVSRKSNILLMGDSGLGKTGALASLVIAGYNLRIMDFDNGVNILANLLKPGIKPYILTPEQSAAALARVEYETLTDQYKSLAGRMFPASAKAWPAAVNLLTKWGTLGPVDTWGERDVLVIDSLNFAGRAATRYMLSLNGKLAVNPVWTDFLDAQRLLESMLATLYSDQIKCNVVVLTHVREIGKKQTIEKDGKIITVEEEGSRKGYAETGTGAALSPAVARYFNDVLLTDIIGSGAHARRVIRTVPHENIGLKNSAPGSVKPEYPLATGLADYFAAIRGEVLPAT